MKRMVRTAVSVTLGCAVIVGLTGCATKGDISDSVMMATSPLEEKDKKLEQRIGAQEQKLAEATQTLAAIKSELEQMQSTLATSLNEQESRLDSLEDDWEKQSERLDQRLSQALSTLDQKQNEMDQVVAEAQQKVEAQIDGIDAHVDSRVDDRLQLIRTEVDLVRQESRDLANKTEFMAGNIRSALHHQRDVMATQFNTLNSLTQQVDEILGGDGNLPATASRYFKDAKKALEKAMNDPNSENYAEALTLYKKGLDLDPNSLSGNYNTALILIEMDRIEEARYHLERVIDLDSDGKYRTDAENALANLRSN